VKIHLPSYPLGVHKIDESLLPQDLKLDSEEFFTSIQAHLTLDRHDPYLQFTFELETKVHQQCDRCLTDFEHPLFVRSPMLYVLGHPPAGDDVDDPEISYIPVTTVELDISNDLRDFIILALPEKHLCSEDCQGLCSNCGADLNLGPCACRRDEPIDHD
jgi:uncharacterized protein